MNSKKKTITVLLMIIVLIAIVSGNIISVYSSEINHPKMYINTSFSCENGYYYMNVEYGFEEIRKEGFAGYQTILDYNYDLFERLEVENLENLIPDKCEIFLSDIGDKITLTSPDGLDAQNIKELFRFKLKIKDVNSLIQEDTINLSFQYVDMYTYTIDESINYDEDTFIINSKAINEILNTNIPLSTNEIKEEKKEVEPYSRGDITGDGVIDVVDLSTLNRIIVGESTISEEYISSADLDKDGEITVTDLSILNKLLVE